MGRGDIYIPEGFARVASPKSMSDCHTFRMNVCDAGRHTGTQRHKKRVDIDKSASVACAHSTGAGQTSSFGTPAGL